VLLIVSLIFPSIIMRYVLDSCAAPATLHPRRSKQFPMSWCIRDTSGEACAMISPCCESHLPCNSIVGSNPFVCRTKDAPHLAMIGSGDLRSTLSAPLLAGVQLERRAQAVSDHFFHTYPLSLFLKIQTALLCQFWKKIWTLNSFCIKTFFT